MARQPSLLFPVSIVLGLMQALTLVVGQPQVPCYYIFGDSLVDNGNNNALLTLAKANYPPYGIDFPLGVTGRFTNGRTVPDIIGELLGFPDFIPPFATATDQQISTGVNYGSSFAGIRDETGSQVGDRISLNRQLVNHAAVVSRLRLKQQNKTFINDYLKKCIYTLTIGGNDYINNYFLPNNSPTHSLYTTEQYAAVLVGQYSQQLKTLYKLGATKVAVFGLVELGCIPAMITTFGTNGKPCVEFINDAVKLFNDRLKPLVDEINNDFPDARFTFINTTNISEPQGALSDVPCCQLGDEGLCVRNSTPCSNRALVAFYDAVHPTEIVNTFVAIRSYTRLSPMDATPYDISDLAKL